MEKDLYKVLGLEKGASDDEIRKAYRRLAKKHHPDKNQGKKEAEEKFKEISHAYDILKDPEKRNQYEAMQEAAKRGFDPRGFGGEEVFRKARAGGGGQQHGFNFDDLGLGDMFGNMFDLGSRDRRARYGPQVGEDINFEITVPFELAAKGGKVSIKIPREESCSNCGGTGAAPGSKPTPCPECHGSGTLARNMGGSFAFSQACPRCYGRGHLVLNPCTSCSGRGIASVRKSLKVSVPPGAADGDRLRVPGQGEPGVAGGPPGDLVLTIRVNEHPDFGRRGQDILSEVRVDIVTASLGGKVTTSSLEGPLKISIPEGVRGGQKLRLRGKGLAKRDGTRGDQIVTVYVDAPQHLSDKQRELLEEFSKS